MSVKDKLIELIKNDDNIVGVTLKHHDFDTVNKWGSLYVYSKHPVSYELIHSIESLYLVNENEIPDEIYDQSITVVTNRICSVNTDHEFKLIRGIDY